MTFGGKTTTYVYDSQNQLIRENNQAGGYTYQWTYDDAGNILSRKRYNYTTAEELDGNFEVTETLTYTYDANWGDLLTKVNNLSITYDTVGNPLNYYNGYSFTWENGRRLSTMAVGMSTWTMGYDNSGMRIRRTDGTTDYRYAYNGGKLTQMTVNNTVLDFTYDASGAPMTVTYDGMVYYYVTNLQGDVTAILNYFGIPVVEYTYDAWGNILSTTGSMAYTLGQLNPLRYRGYVYDSETGFYYLQSRYYDPAIGRFVNADGQISGVGGEILGCNMFTYCMNNPVNMNDSRGKWPRWITAAVAVTAAVVFAVTAAPAAAITTVVASATYVTQTWHFDVRASKNEGMDDLSYEQAKNLPGADINVSDTFHDFSGDNNKVCLPDGREGIYDSIGAYVDDPRDIGTYNYYVPKDIWSSVGHAVVDVLPYLIFGNNDEDPGFIINFAVKWSNQLIDILN